MKFRGFYHPFCVMGKGSLIIMGLVFKLIKAAIIAELTYFDCTNWVL